MIKIINRSKNRRSLSCPERHGLQGSVDKLPKSVFGEADYRARPSCDLLETALLRRRIIQQVHYPRAIDTTDSGLYPSNRLLRLVHRFCPKILIIHWRALYIVRRMIPGPWHLPPLIERKEKTAEKLKIVANSPCRYQKTEQMTKEPEQSTTRRGA